MSARPAGRARFGRRSTALAALATLTMVFLVLLPAPAASAHAFLVSSTPGDGSTVTAPPSEIRFSFSESVALDAMRIDIVDSSGQHYQPTAVRLADRAGATDDSEEPVEVLAILPILKPDAYRVSWQTLSSDDLHATNGVLVFGIGQSVAAAGSAEPLPRFGETLLRFVVFLALALALGGLLGNELIRRSGGSPVDSPAARRSSSAALGGAAVGIVASIGLLAEQLAAGGLSADEVLFSAFGLHVALRVLGFGVLLSAALAQLRPVPAMTVARGLTVIGAATIGIQTALMGHSGAAVDGSATRVAADATHLLAAAAWVGTLLVLVFLVLPPARREAGVTTTEVLKQFGVPAVACFAVMVITGVYLASGVVASVDALLFTFYGKALIGKLLLVGAIAVLGLINHRRLRGRRAGSVPRWTIAAEACAALAVLGLAAVLTSSQPAMEPEFIGAATDSSVSLRDALAGDLQETVEVQPNVPGRNVILIGTADTRRPAPAPIENVLVTVVGADGQPAQSMTAVRADGQWTVGTVLAGGRFQLRVTVQRPGMADVTENYPWALAGNSSAGTGLVSNAPLRGALQAASGLMLVVALAAVAVGTRRRRRRSMPAPAAELGQSDADTRVDSRV